MPQAARTLSVPLSGSSLLNPAAGPTTETLVRMVFPSHIKVFFSGYHSTCPQMSLGLPTVDLAAPPDMQLEGIKAFPAEYAPFHCFLYVCRCNRLHEFLQIYSVRSLALPRSVVSIAPVCA